MRFKNYVAGAIVASVCGAALAAAGVESGQVPGGPGARPMHGPGHGAERGPHGFGGPPHGVQLTEAQQDKVFAIMHAAEPRRREHMKAVRKAHEALRAVREADKFDDAKAAAAAKALGEATAASALQEARVHAQLDAVLTAEQRQQARKAKAEREERMENMERGRRDGQGEWRPDGRPGRRGDSPPDARPDEPPAGGAAARGR